MKIADYCYDYVYQIRGAVQRKAKGGTEIGKQGGKIREIKISQSSVESYKDTSENMYKC